MRWVVQQKLRERGAGEIALIQKVSYRQVEQIWQACRRDGAIPALKKPSRASEGIPVKMTCS